MRAVGKLTVRSTWTPFSLRKLLQRMKRLDPLPQLCDKAENLSIQMF